MHSVFSSSKSPRRWEHHIFRMSKQYSTSKINMIAMHQSFYLFNTRTKNGTETQERSEDELRSRPATDSSTIRVNLEKAMLFFISEYLVLIRTRRLQCCIPLKAFNVFFQFMVNYFSLRPHRSVLHTKKRTMMTNRILVALSSSSDLIKDVLLLFPASLEVDLLVLSREVLGPRRVLGPPRFKGAEPFTERKRIVIYYYILIV